MSAIPGGGEPDAAVKKRLGRPRNRRVPADLDAREEILNAAAELFGAQGFSATTTRQIAAAAGLEQGSIFHYFQRKADLLAELLDRTLEPALSYASWLECEAAPPDEKLFLLAYRDTLNICSGPHNLAGLMLLREASGTDFDPYWRKRLQLKATYGRYISAGLSADLFKAADAELATELVFGLVESSIYWFRRGTHDPEYAATHVGVGVLRLVLSHPERQREVVRKASALTDGGPDELLVSMRAPISLLEPEGDH